MTNKTALVLMEFQNDFVSKEGKFFNALETQVVEGELLERANKAAEIVRSKGGRVIHVKLGFSADYRELGDMNHGVLHTIKEAGAFQRGTRGYEIAERVEINDSDIIIDGKTTLDAFASTNLEMTLRRLGVENVIFAGQLADLCIESSARTSYDRGFRTWTLTDTMTSLVEANREWVANNSFDYFSTRVTLNDINRAF